ncbi:hypothetical protein A33K_16565 [Burkholderia humptydooensis MSMB43]|uniref:Uncharacterized protein n=1 Tax=Burkholderia humptydooensis MSMB43 TaxID=441157 RepID=A0ABN0G3W4_9BURK|nr:hypothetical protein A33K_16565 [Burkholderia humptydooensis MSMB43]
MVDTSGKHRSIACGHALPRVSRATDGPPLTRIKRALGRRGAHAAAPQPPRARFDPIGQKQPNRAQFHLNIDDKRLRPTCGRPRVRDAASRPPRPGSKTLKTALTTARNERARATPRAGPPARLHAAAPAAAGARGAGSAARRSTSPMQSTRQEDFHP